MSRNLKKENMRKCEMYEEAYQGSHNNGYSLINQNLKHVENQFINNI